MAVSAFAVFVTSLSSSAAAQAQGLTDRTLAESLFRQGRDLMEKGNVSEACAKLSESYRLDKALGTLLNLAVCHEKEGKVATAWAEFNDAADEAHREHDDREAYARKRATALEPAIPRIRLDVRAAPALKPSLQIQIDGVVIRSAALTALLPVDPGNHRIEVGAPGKKSWTSTFVVALGSSSPSSPASPSYQAIVVPDLEDAPPPPPRSQPPQLVDTYPPTSSASSGTSQRVAGFVVGGVGLAGIVVGSVFGVRALGLKDERDDECFAGNRCSAAGLEKDDDARRAATLSTIGFAAGGALLATGLVLIVTAPSRSSGTVAIGRVAGGSGLVVGGAW